MRAQNAEFERKKAIALTILVEKSIFKNARWPWQLKALWALGLKKRPPLFASFISNAVFFGVQWGGVYGFFMWFTIWKSQGIPFERAVGLCALGGLFFGCAMAGLSYFQARKKQLPSWESL
ncbi:MULTISPECIES: DUF6404 family protein [Deefgea]|uniref:Uncharacterized protein n=1 Tax=Deefgea chitinilytica TaxID=570276 RepID=A0ABS2C9K9_9NEIS|nr:MULTISPECIES: DUF6404 family protein [Deefgea]MBM5570826.1 hypothetical protein [Deefgea chitinilytica]MBM9888055.1 hypothetical protein [Deefgea sp. CFH1-16]